jgi:AraC-like DNA-binding protein
MAAPSVSTDPTPPPLAYVERQPPTDLAPWIACFWQIVGRASGETMVPHRVLPDGCADLLFDLVASRRTGATPTGLIGPMSGAQVFGLHGAIDLLGVRFRPGALAVVSDIPAECVLDATAPLSELPKSLRVNVAELADLATSAARIELLAAACRHRLSGADGPDTAVGFALRRWARAESPQFPKVSVLTRDLGLSERAFERRFLAQVGFTPVRYRRLARFRSVLRLHAAGLRDWAALAATTGFSDQAHLVRDFRAFAGLTPTEWAASQACPAGFLQDGHVTTL